jgi:glycosyltransferase involved in cell wall biosynthesis
MAHGFMVSVIMPVFNAERFLKSAIQSILDQSFKDFELIIVDDGSKDRSFEIAAKFRKLDSRIQLIRLLDNSGVAIASNMALQNSGGKYVARMDADDISLPERFSRQVEFMETHLDVGALGCGMRFMDENGRLLSAPPLFMGDLSIHWHSLFESPFFSATVMIRKSILSKWNLQYDPSYFHGEDYELWSRLLPLTKGENLSEILYHYRLHPESITHRYQYIDINQEMAVNVAAQAVNAYLPNLNVTEQEIIQLQRAIWGASKVDKCRRANLVPVYLKIWKEFCRKNKGNPNLPQLEQEVIAWAARMILYPPFQPGILKGLLQLTNEKWKWPIYILKHIPYFLSRRLK